MDYRLLKIIGNFSSSALKKGDFQDPSQNNVFSDKLNCDLRISVKTTKKFSSQVMWNTACSDMDS